MSHLLKLLFMTCLRDRLKEYLRYKGLKNKAFEVNVGLSNGALNKMGDNTRVETLDRISIKYPDLNMVWLRTGEGSMLKEVEKSEIELHGSNTGIIQNRSKLKVGGNLTTGTTDSTIYKQRIKDLEQLLAEKERTIQILMGKNNVK